MNKEIRRLYKINMTFEETVNMILDYTKIDYETKKSILMDSKHVHIFFDEENGMEVLVEF